MPEPAAAAPLEKRQAPAAAEPKGFTAAGPASYGLVAASCGASPPSSLFFVAAMALVVDFALAAARPTAAARDLAPAALPETAPGARATFS